MTGTIVEGTEPCRRLWRMKAGRSPSEQRSVASGSAARRLLRTEDIGSSPTNPTTEKVLRNQGFFFFAVVVVLYTT